MAVPKHMLLQHMCVCHADLKRDVTSDVDQIIPAVSAFPTSSLLSWSNCGGCGNTLGVFVLITTAITYLVVQSV